MSRGLIVATGDGGVSFGGETGDLPVASPVVLGKVAEEYPVETFEDGAVIGTFPTGDVEAAEFRDAEDIRAVPVPDDE